MQRSLAKRVWYVFLQHVFRLTGIVLAQLRVRGRHCEPPDGPVIVLSNHQSHLDPVLIGLSCKRRLNFLARDTLFRFSPFRWLIDSLDAIPFDREGLGLAGLKETLRRLKRGEMVLIFPEGTRTTDGKVAPLKPGFCAIARRGNASLWPVAIAGAFTAWPRQRLLPWPATINIELGEPISPEQIRAFSDRELIAEIQRRITACHAAASATVQLASHPGSLRTQP